MDAVPEVRYARSGGVNIAYTRWGEGSHVVVYTPPLASNVELIWELPEWSRACRHAGAHHQCVMIDKRGVGLSDRVRDAPTLDERVADTLAVMDAEDLDAVDLEGHSEGGTIAIALAARHAERVRSLVLIDTPVFGATWDELANLADEDDPLPTPDEEREKLRSLVRSWGSERSVNLELFAPTAAADPAISRWYQRYERQSASRGAILDFLRSAAKYDIRPMLESITTPTLVTHARGDRITHVTNGRYLARAIPHARYIEYDIADHIWMLAPEWRDIQDDSIEFVTGVRPETAQQTAFAIVLFTDIVDSTRQGASVGDSSWRILLERHDRLGHGVVSRHGGRIVKQTGDGLLATFADPAGALTAGLELSEQLAASGLPIRAGLHAGVIELHEGGDVSGIAVNIAARVQSQAQANEVLVSETLRDLLLGTTFVFHDRGETELKGLERARRLFAAHHRRADAASVTSTVAKKGFE